MPSGSNPTTLSKWGERELSIAAAGGYSELSCASSGDSKLRQVRAVIYISVGLVHDASLKQWLSASVETGRNLFEQLQPFAADFRLERNHRGVDDRDEYSCARRVLCWLAFPSASALRG
jgi:hypothetical protein